MVDNLEVEKSQTSEIPLEYKNKTNFTKACDTRSAETIESVDNAQSIVDEIKTEEETKDSQKQEDREEILSKRKQKKLLKIAKWEETKKIKRQKEKQRQKERRTEEVKLGVPGPSSKRKKLKQNRIDDSPNLISVAIDFDYEELMDDKDIAKCAKQMLRVYTENRRSIMPIKLHFTSIKENGRVEKSLSRNDGYKNWDVKIHETSYLEQFDHRSIVYLTSDSDNVLNELEPNTVYIIGGLVDHNHHKGLSFQRAQENGLRSARLPLSEHIEMKTRSVLTIVHVFEILLKVSEGKPWKETLLEVLPQRKFRIGGRQRKRKPENSLETGDSNDDCDTDNESNHEKNGPIEESHSPKP